MLKQENIKSNAPPVVYEYTGAIDCSRLRSIHTSPSPLCFGLFVLPQSTGTVGFSI